jgi:hypothetical protein
MPIGAVLYVLGDEVSILIPGHPPMLVAEALRRRLVA